MLLIRRYHLENVEEFVRYESEQIKQIEELEAYDNEEYRIAQLQNRSMSYNTSTANRNESLAFGYKAVEQYTSGAEKTQLARFEKVGYYNWMDSMVVKDCFNLPVDSFLGIKYVLSPYSIDGLKKIESLKDWNGKNVYDNPYALPFVITCDKYSFTAMDSDNPFVYINRFYSCLYGEQINVFHPVEFQRTDIDLSSIFSLTLLDKNIICYGFTSGLNSDDSIIVGDELLYTRARNPKCLFYIPIAGSSGGIKDVLIQTKRPENLRATFWYIDLSEFKLIIDKLKRSNPEIIEISDGKIRLHVCSENDTLVVTSVCMEKGWTAYVNGKKLK